MSEEEDQRRLDTYTEIKNSFLYAKKNHPHNLKARAIAVIEELEIIELIGKPQVIEKIVYRKEFQTTEEERTYQKWYREKAKRERAIKGLEERRKEKLQSALRVKTASCVRCHTIIQVEDPTYEIKHDKSSREKIIISFSCPNCKQTSKRFGGWFPKC